jgi:hypothetical protein
VCKICRLRESLVMQWRRSTFMKKMATVIFLVIAAVCIDSLFSYLGVPIVTMDLIFVLLSIAIIGWVCSPSYLSGEYMNWDQTQSENTFTKLLGLVSAALALLLLSMLMIYMGFSNPLELYIGVRGSGHGYSLSIVGLAILFFVFSTAYVYLIKKCITKS